MPDESWAPRAVPPETEPDAGADHSAEGLLTLVARGDELAFGRFYDTVITTVWAVVRHVVRDYAQSEEVAQEVMVEVWRTASRFDETRGSALSWVNTMAHRRAVDRVRAEQAATRRDQAVAEQPTPGSYDEVSEQVDVRFEQQRVRRCVKQLTQLQRESVLLAFYQGYSYPELSTLLGSPLGTIKTRMRDGLIRLRDCLGVAR